MSIRTWFRLPRLAACAALLLVVATGGAQTVTVPATLVSYPDQIISQRADIQWEFSTPWDKQEIPM